MKTLDLYITKLCNLNCEYCYVDLEKREDGFNYSVFSERVNLFDYDHIKFFGGEPLIKWEEIKKIVNLFEGKNKKFTIVTNGLLLDKNKLNFCLENRVEVVISMHFKSIKVLLLNIRDFLFANSILGFSFIFEDKKINYPYKIVSFLEKLGFTNFILTPEVFGDWNDRKLNDLELELSLFIDLYKKNRKIKFSGPSSNNLVKLIKGCTKNIYSKDGDRKICNRFKSIENLKGNIIPEIYKKFNEIIDYDNDPNKWFYVCPIGWYLDTILLESNFEERIIQYKNLNRVFLDFYKKINNLKGKINFLIDNIDEVRFNLTSQCNIRCKYCYVNFKNDKLDLSVAKNIIDYFVLREGENKTISFFGGEPLLEFELLKDIVYYSKDKFSTKNKKINFKIATNFLLINEEKISFLKENNFEIHISFNGRKEVNDYMRDNSTLLLLKKLDRFILDDMKKNIVILFAFSNLELNKLYDNLEFILSLGFSRVNFEMIFGKDYSWKKQDFILLNNIFKRIRKSQLFEKLDLNVFNDKNILDIFVDGSCSDNSLEFNGYEAYFEKQKIFKRILLKNFYNENNIN